MKNLNEIYKAEELFYYCNTTGDINIPGSGVLSVHEVDKLPLKARNLYENYWFEGGGCNMYVVRYKDDIGMILGFLFDESYLCDFLKKDEVSDEEMTKFYNAISDYANLLERSNKISGCDIFVGENTDPDGHELLVFVPYDKRNDIRKITEMLDKEVYRSVEELY